MKRCLTLGISLCLLGLLSGCCCGQRCGFGRCGSPCATSCSPCGQPFGAFAPIGGGCSTCSPGGFGGAPVYGSPGFGGIPATYNDPYGFGTASTLDGSAVPTAAVPMADGMPATAIAQPSYGQPVYGTAMGAQPVYGQPAAMGQAPVTTALVKPESLATY